MSAPSPSPGVTWTLDHPCSPPIWYCSAGNGLIPICAHARPMGRHDSTGSNVSIAALQGEMEFVSAEQASGEDGGWRVGGVVMAGSKAKG